MHEQLNEIDTANWQALSQAALNKEHALRQLVISSVNTEGEPQSRLLILRHADAVSRTLTFHTDIRSPKWQQLQTQNTVSVLAYDTSQSTQLRLSGKVTLYSPTAEITKQTWLSLSTWTQSNYCGGPPGKRCAQAHNGIGEPTEQQSARGKQVFGLIEFQAASMDWYTHQRGRVNRAMFQYNTHGNLTDASWLNP